MKKLYQKSELTFALVLIAIYCILQSLANPLSDLIGIENSAQAVVGVTLTVLLYGFIRKNGLSQRYGLCRTTIPAQKFLWYIPLVLIASHNLWNGIAVNYPPADTLCGISHMLCVGFVEEVLFRGFLFRAIARDSVKMAVIISSVTFGLGHILNLFNGSGMELLDNICQVCVAIAAGFLFVIIFCRGGSLIPCILTHSAIDVTSVFANAAGITDVGGVLFSLSLLLIVVAYTLVLTRTLPKKMCISETT